MPSSHPPRAGPALHGDLRAALRGGQHDAVELVVAEPGHLGAEVDRHAAAGRRKDVDGQPSLVGELAVADAVGHRVRPRGTGGGVEGERVGGVRRPGSCHRGDLQVRGGAVRTSLAVVGVVAEHVDGHGLAGGDGGAIVVRHRSLVRARAAARAGAGAAAGAGRPAGRRVRRGGGAAVGGERRAGRRRTTRRGWVGERRSRLAGQGEAEQGGRDEEAGSRHGRFLPRGGMLILRTRWPGRGPRHPTEEARRGRSAPRAARRFRRPARRARSRGRSAACGPTARRALRRC